MSDQVLIALITGLSVAIPGLVAQGVILVRLCRKIDDGNASVKRDTHAAIERRLQISELEIELIKKGAYREGHVAGQEYVRTSGLGALDSRQGPP